MSLPSTTLEVLEPELLYWRGELRADLALAIDGNGHVAAAPRKGEGPARALPGAVLLPGLVNAHSHAFQRLIRGRTEFVAPGHAADDFWSWRELMYQAACALEPEDVYVASRQAFLEMALAGITAVGEFHYLHHAPDGTPYEDRGELAHQVIRAAKDVGLRICLLRVGYARAGHQAPPNPRQRRFIDPDPDVFLAAALALRERYRGDPLVTVGLAPHSVRAVGREWLEAVAPEKDVLHMHVAEQPAEIAACQREHGRRPVELLGELGLLRPGFTAVHAIHLAPHEAELLGRAGACACACPSTERNLGDGVIPADELLGQGVTLCLGTDSQAGIDLLDEARQLESHLRLVRLRRAVLDPREGRQDGLGRRLFDLATRGGAQSLGLPVGTLEPGAPADFFLVDLGHPSLAGASAETLLPSLVFGGDKAAIREVYVGGRCLVRGGQHPLLEQSRADFTALARRIFA